MNVHGYRALQTYGLAGLRVGYTVAHREVITALQKVTLPFAVNALAPGRGASLSDRRGRAGGALRERDCRAAGAPASRCPPRRRTSSGGRCVSRPRSSRCTASAGGVIARPFSDVPGGVRVTIGCRPRTSSSCPRRAAGPGPPRGSPTSAAPARTVRRVQPASSYLQEWIRPPGRRRRPASPRTAPPLCPPTTPCRCRSRRRGSRSSARRERSAPPAAPMCRNR